MTSGLAEEPDGRAFGGAAAQSGADHEVVGGVVCRVGNVRWEIVGAVDGAGRLLGYVRVNDLAGEL